MSISKKEMGKRLCEERKLIGLTQEEMATKLAIGRGTQIRYENGSRIPSADYLAGVANLGINPMYLITGKRQLNPQHNRPPNIPHLLDMALRILGIDFISTQSCDHLGEGCIDCDESQTWCRWRLNTETFNNLHGSLTVPSGNFPWSGISHELMYQEILADPLATRRERALTELGLETAELFNYDYEDLHSRFARVLCQLLHSLEDKIHQQSQ